MFYVKHSITLTLTHVNTHSPLTRKHTHTQTVYTPPYAHFNGNNIAFYFSNRLRSINGRGVAGDIDHMTHKFSAKGTEELADLWDAETESHKQI